MKAYFDTNILIAALLASHPHHAGAFRVLAQVHAGKMQGYLAAHGLAELYSVFTRAPFTPPISPRDALSLITESVEPFFTIVNVTHKGYRSAINTCAAAGWKGGRIYDAIHIQAARQASCQVLYTFNLPDFRALAPDLADLIRSPS